MPDDQILAAITSLSSQIAVVSAQQTTLCKDVGDIKEMLERQNGRVRALEVGQATRQEQINGIRDDVAVLQKESASRNSMVWNAFNSIGVAIASYIALRT